MRIRSIEIENFRAIRKLEMSGLPDAVVVAGPNGCGKSSLFDAIRLLKSAYGQYHQNEYQAWFSEFQINVQRIKQEAHRVLHDPEKTLRIKAEFELTTSEIEYIRQNARELYSQLNWAQFRGMYSPDGEYVVINPATRRAQGPIVESQTAKLMSALEKVIDDQTHIAELSMSPGNDPVATPSPVMELVFSIFKPQHLGIVDYHGPNRSYGREKVGGLNLQIIDPAAKQSQHALYNTQGKYSGVKTEMAQSLLRQLLAREAGVPEQEESDLKTALDELFTIFFPGKKFLGARPTQEGGLEFPVELSNGRKHDINELSSGEKEVLLGYLRLRNSAPQNSIILLDEPELHLNPRLVSGLPRFYQKHLGEAFGNQLWLITHSDALMREAVEEPAYAVYHMQLSDSMLTTTNQVDIVSATAEVERTIIDLVGDLATYNPRSKVVLLEGENSQIDANLVSELFPEFAEQVNLISAGGKNRVGKLHDLLEVAAEEGRLDARFYSIVDRDFDGSELVDSERRFSWDVYHIENYLLKPNFVQEAMRSLQLGGHAMSEDQIFESLKVCAEETVDDLVRIQLDQQVNQHLVQCISTKFNPSLTVAQGFREAAERSLERMRKRVEEDLTIDNLAEKESHIRSKLHSALEDGQWLSAFRGRDILKRFTGKHADQLGVPYEKLRNLIINRMRDAGYRPSGMIQVINAISSQ